MHFISPYWRLRIKLSQIKFCEDYLQKQKQFPNYKYYLKHVWKKEPVKYSFFQVSIYDVLDNTGFNKLIRQVYRLKHNKQLKVDTHYKLHKFRKVNYIRSNITGQQVGTIARIFPVNDKWIRSIEIAYTYVNNSQAIIQYTFFFNKTINTLLKIHQFVEDNISYVKKEIYFLSHTFTDRFSCREMLNLDEYLFDDILQAYICSLFYTQYGAYYRLPIEYSCRLTGYNQKIKNRLRKAFLCSEYEKNNSHIIVHSVDERYEMDCFCFGEGSSNPQMFRFFADFPSEMYFTAFYQIEERELERRMRKHLNSNKSFVSSKDLKWLVNKKRYITDQAQRMKRTLSDDYRRYIDHLVGWSCYVDGKKQNYDFLNYPEMTDHFLNLYNDNLAYLNTLASVQNNKVLVIVGAATFIATIIGICLH